MNTLNVLREVDFDWATRLYDVWNDAAWDVPELHANIRAELVAKLTAMRSQTQVPSPLGWIIVGAGGTGKTHLLGEFRREAVRQKDAFVLVDMTDVRDFWETVLQGYLDSLQVRYDGDLFQHQCLLRSLLKKLKLAKKSISDAMASLARHRSSDLAKDIKGALSQLSRLNPNEPLSLSCQNVVRALICLNSTDHSIANLGMVWLQGQEIEPSERQTYGFTTAREEPRKIVKALSWLMSLNGPTILAFDQLDPIVTQLNFRKLGETAADEQGAAQSIIAAIGGGLGALRDTTRNTLAIVSCVEGTWDILRHSVLSQSLDRFEPPRQLHAVNSCTVAQAVVRNRLAAAFEKTGFSPPYATWPFRPEAFEELKNDTPREVLKKCEQHGQLCLRDGTVRELPSFATMPKNNPGNFEGDELNLLDRRFAQFKAEADVPAITKEKDEDERLAPLLQTALQCLTRERDLPFGVDVSVDSEFPSGKTTQPLHARLRLTFHNENSREEHFCVRALQLTNARSYQYRLKAAMTQSGIDRALKFRRLTIVRSTEVPGGKVTKELTENFQKAGGLFCKPTDDELRSLHALFEMKRQGHPDFEKWLRGRQPVSRLALIRTIVPSTLCIGESAAVDQTPLTEFGGGQPPGSVTKVETSGPTRAYGTTPPPEADIPLGRRLIAGKVGETVMLPVKLLEKHTIVLAGAGSGKTVLLRRLVEEVALLGIPAIVIDAANDLATLDETWPSRPVEWQPEDDEKAKRYHDTTEVILWTPGRESGNPLALEPLPDLAAVSSDAEELEQAIGMVRESLAPIVASGKSESAKNKLGVLSGALRYFATHGGGRLPEFIALLNDLPSDAGLDLANEAKLAGKMADALKAEVEINPLLRSAGSALDPAVLFGDDRSFSRTRISVINFSGLPGLDSQRHFLNQLAMTLFSWIKKNPAPGERPLRGLLVIDEAKDFVPSLNSSVCKDSMIRLAAQARKYHLGLVLATQNPKEIDNKIIANCSTHFYGKVNSPAAIDTIRDLIQAKGGVGDDVPRLGCGQFYLHNADMGISAPIKIATQLCLSRHPESPLDEVAVLEKAVSCRTRLKSGE